MNQIDEIKELQRQGLGPQEIAGRLKLNRKTAAMGNLFTMTLGIQLTVSTWVSEQAGRFGPNQWWGLPSHCIRSPI